MRGIILHTIYSARRDKFILGLFIGMIACALVAGFLGSTALVESDQMRVIYTSSACRFVSMIGMMVFISFHIKRLFENKEMDVFLSRISSRSSIIFSFIVAFAIITTTIVMQATLIVCFSYMQSIFNTVIWSLSLLLEGILVVCMSTFFAIIIRSSTLGLLMSFAGYILSRVIGNFVAYIDMSNASISFHYITEVLLKVLSVVIPRLDLFAKSGIIVYGEYSLHSIGILILQTVIYSSLLIFLSIMDIRRREF